MSGVFEIYEGVRCITYDALVSSGIMTKNVCDKAIQRKRIRRPRRGHYGSSALIDLSSLPEHIIAEIEDIYGEDVETAADRDTLRGMYEWSDKAYSYYSDRSNTGDRQLTQPQIREYTTNAAMLDALQHYYTSKVAYISSKGGSVSGLWTKVAELCYNLKKGNNQINHTLPRNPRRLRERLDNYLQYGYGNLISGKLGNSNSAILTNEQQQWLLQRWMDNVNKVPGTTELFVEYNNIADKFGWKKLKSAQTIINYLWRQEITPIWYGQRYGELAYKEKFCYQHSTKLPSMRDSIWYSDGTKLNLYYRYTDKSGKIKIGTKQVYEVMDSYSEVFLGYCISNTENFLAQRRAYKMAFQVSGHRPYQITYDNQGGHNKGEAGDLFNKLAHHNIHTAPYNGKSKTIESAFGRFQQHVIKKIFGFTGQNITAKSLESRPNMEFILANTDKLPTYEELLLKYQECREEWNNAMHPSLGTTRIQAYKSSVNDKSPEVGLMEMVDMFYYTRPEQVRCTAYGLMFTEDKVKYNYMVTHDSLPDIEWLSHNIDKKFTVMYDPDDMGMIFLYEKTSNGLKYVCPAVTKTVIHRGKQEQEEWEAKFIKQTELANKALRVKTKQEAVALQQLFGTSAEDYGYKTPLIKGVETSAAYKRKREKVLVAAQTEVHSIGEYTKEISNRDFMDDDIDSDINISELY